MDLRDKDEAPPEWVDLTYAVMAILSKATPASDMMVAAIGPIVGLGQAQKRTLDALKHRLDLLISEPIASSERLLELAGNTPPGDERTHLIREAQTKVVEASVLAKAPADRAIAAARLGAIQLLLQNRDGAIGCLQQSLAHSETETAYLLERANDLAVFDGFRRIYALAYMFYPFYWLPKKVAKAWRAELAVPAIEAQLDFQAGVLHLLSNVSEHHEGSTLVLTELPEQARYALAR